MFGDSLMSGNISGTVIRESFYFYKVPKWIYETLCIFLHVINHTIQSKFLLSFWAKPTIKLH